MRLNQGNLPQHTTNTDFCRLCDAISAAGRKEIWNQPLLESQNFVVLPSLGALVVGWLLVVPRQHFLSAAALPPDLLAELRSLKETVYSMVKREFGSACVFEHGPSRRQRQTGCGVDHAHVHVVPVDFDLREKASQFLPPELEWRSTDLESCRLAVDRQIDYLYIEQPLGTERIAFHTEFPSQVFRRAIAAELGVEGEYSWREHPQLSNLRATRETFRARSRARRLVHTKLRYHE